jgi:nitroreductase
VSASLQVGNRSEQQETASREKTPYIYEKREAFGSPKLINSYTLKKGVPEIPERLLPILGILYMMKKYPPFLSVSLRAAFLLRNIISHDIEKRRCGSMNVIHAIMTRRNIKEFKPDPIDQQQVISWLEAASYAPNHRLTEPWEIIFLGTETRARLNHKTNFGGAPLAFAVLSKSGASQLERDENVMAAACFVQNFLLASHEAGVGASWSSIGASPRSREILGVPEGYDVIGVFGVGYPANVPAVKERTAITAKTSYLP